MLATTRLSEHWIHAHDIADPLGIDYPDTSRLWHIAWLSSDDPGRVFARRQERPTLRSTRALGPDGEHWELGDAGAEVTITGSAGEFVRVAARRLAASDAKSLRGKGERAFEVLECVRTYA